MSRYFQEGDVFREQYDNRERIEHLAHEALDPLKALYDALEDEINDAMEQDDIARVLMISWFYGQVAGLVTEIETHFG